MGVNTYDTGGIRAAKAAGNFALGLFSGGLSGLIVAPMAAAESIKDVKQRIKFIYVLGKTILVEESDQYIHPPAQPITMELIQQIAPNAFDK